MTLTIQRDRGYAVLRCGRAPNSRKVEEWTFDPARFEEQKSALLAAANLTARGFSGSGATRVEVALLFDEDARARASDFRARLLAREADYERRFPWRGWTPLNGRVIRGTASLK